MTKQDHSRIKPLACEIAHRDFATKFDKKISQVGEIKYHEEPDEELMRHYKVRRVRDIFCLNCY